MEKQIHLYDGDFRYGTHQPLPPLRCTHADTHTYGLFPGHVRKMKDGNGGRGRTFERRGGLSFVCVWTQCTRLTWTHASTSKVSVEFQILCSSGHRFTIESNGG